MYTHENSSQQTGLEITEHSRVRICPLKGGRLRYVGLLPSVTLHEHITNCS